MHIYIYILVSVNCTIIEISQKGSMSIPIFNYWQSQTQSRCLALLAAITCSDSCSLAGFCSVTNAILSCSP